MKNRVRIRMGKTYIVFGWLACLSFHAYAQTDSQIEQYIQTYKSIAEEEMIRSGVPASISLAQGIIESQAGTGWLATHANNQFGIKCKSSWTGPTILHTDDAPNECFRSYNSPDSSWKDHSDFLRSSPRYSFLFSINPLDYKAWARGLKQAGYATDPTYAAQLINTIEKFHLQHYSKVVYAEMKNNNQENAFAAMLDKKVEEDRLAMGIVPHQARQTPPKEKVIVTSPYPDGLFKINNLKVLYLPAGTQLISIAEKYRIRLNRLVKYNELRSDVLNKNMLIYLEKKKKKGAQDTCILNTGETLHEIAQKEGIRLKWLLKRNRIHKGQIVQAGEILYLKRYAPLETDELTMENNSKHPANNNNWKKKLADLLSSQNKNIPPSENDSSQLSSTEKTNNPEKNSHDSSASEYTIRKGDTLYNISKRYNITIEQLKQWNHLDNNIIKIGQKLIIHSQQ